jgi:hypothetical protein
MKTFIVRLSDDAVSALGDDAEEKLPNVIAEGINQMSDWHIGLITRHEIKVMEIGG